MLQSHAMTGEIDIEAATLALTLGRNLDLSLHARHKKQVVCKGWKDNDFCVDRGARDRGCHGCRVADMAWTDDDVKQTGMKLRITAGVFDLVKADSESSRE